jgi:hypothetical protein
MPPNLKKVFLPSFKYYVDCNTVDIQVLFAWPAELGSFFLIKKIVFRTCDTGKKPIGLSHKKCDRGTWDTTLTLSPNERTLKSTKVYFWRQRSQLLVG